MIVIVGESASGKSTIAEMLCQKHGTIKKIVTYTTRPKRDYETDGVDYHFVSNERFAEMIKANLFVEYNSYNGWSYGTAKSDCSNEDDVVAVVTPAGLRALKRCGVVVKSIYLAVDRRSRLIKILQRGDNIEEAYRRSLSDVGQFDAIAEEVDFVVKNNEYKLDKIKVLSKVESLLGLE